MGVSKHLFEDDKDTEFCSLLKLDKSKLNHPDRFCYEQLEQTLFPECKIIFIRVIGFQWITYSSFFVKYNGALYGLKTESNNAICTNFLLSEFILPTESMFPHVVPEVSFLTILFTLNQLANTSH